jgi:hypothetical protein
MLIKAGMQHMARLALLWTIVFGCVGCRSTRPAPPPASTPATQSQEAPTTPAAAEPRIVRPFPDITVNLEADGKNSVDVTAWVCLDEGLLEQVACAPATREHESLLVVRAKPSQVHAALLMAGFEPGSPGKWTYENQTIGTIAPTGARLEVLVRYADKARQGRIVERPIREWIRALSAPGTNAAAFPAEPWVFGGSVIAPNRRGMEQGEHYVADSSGSIIGLVTFGDEVIGFSRVTIPPLGTEVTLILRRWRETDSTKK